MRVVIAASLLVAVLVGGFFVGAVNAVADEFWPDW